MALLEDLGGALAALQLLARGGVQVGRAELRECDQLAVLRQVKAQPARHAAHRPRLRRAAHPRYRQPRVHGGPYAGVEQLRLKVYLPVGYGYDIRGDIRGHIARERLDDGQRRDGAAAVVGVQFRGALKQAAVQVEYIARIRLAARRAAQQQRHLPIRPGVLGQVVVDDERIPALPHKLFRHGAARVWREILHRRGVGCVGGDHDGMRQRPMLFQQRDGLRHFAYFLAYGDVDADEVAALLVEDAVYGDCRLAGGAVADDELALPAPYGDHRVYRLDARLNRRVNRTAYRYVRRYHFHLARLVSAERPFAVNRLPQRVDHAPDELIPHRHNHHAPGAPNLGSLFDAQRVAHNHRAHAVLFEVQRHAHNPALELQQLAVRGAGQAVNLGDAVPNLYHRSHIHHSQVAPKLFDLALDYRCDVLPSDCHSTPPSGCGV